MSTTPTEENPREDSASLPTTTTPVSTQGQTAQGQAQHVQAEAGPAESSEFEEWLRTATVDNPDPFGEHIKKVSPEDDIWAAQAASAEPAPIPVPSPTLPARGPRVGTIVFGLVIMAFAALVLVSKLGLAVLNFTLVAFGLLIGTGLALILGGILSAAIRRARRNRARL